MIRRKFFSFTKEEATRQYIIFLLKKMKNYKNFNFKVEVPFRIHNLNKRLDILVSLQKNKPYIIIECKAPNIEITQKTFDQISRYNKIIKSPYLMISNGIQNLFFQIDKTQKKFIFLRKIP
ncbi:type I restriction enzyme HsdR N-terminal domain-containing protein [Blattabacterium cuenoti]